MMTRASHHHPDCWALRPGSNFADDCNCSWQLQPELPLEDRYIIAPVYANMIEHLGSALADILAVLTNAPPNTFTPTSHLPSQEEPGL